jgi:hypothetical protein
MGDTRSLLFGVLLAVCVIVPEAYAQNGIGAYPQIRFSSNAVDPVIEYTLVHHMLAEQDPQPLLRVYGSGRVHVHLPLYMKRAGDYELHLTRTELDKLLHSLVQDGIIDFDHAAVKQQKQQIASQQRASAGVLFHVSDVTETVINIKLDEYQRGPGTSRIAGLKRQFTWKNLEHDAKRFRQLNTLQGAAAATQRLHSFINHPGLQRLP